MKIKCETKYGGRASDEVKGIEAKDGFKVEASFEVPADTLDDASASLLKAFADYGLASLLYRGGASLLNGVFNKTANTEVEYSEERSEKVKTELTRWFSDKCPNKKGKDWALPTGVVVSVEVSRHTHGVVADGKFRDELVIVARHESAGDLEKWLAETVKFGEFDDKHGLSLPTHNPEGEFDKPMLRAVRAYRMRREAEVKAGI